MSDIDAANTVNAGAIKDSLKVFGEIDKIYQRMSSLENALFKAQYQFKVLSFDVTDKMTSEIAQRARTDAIEWVANYTHEIVEDHLKNDHSGLNARFENIEDKLSKIADRIDNLEKNGQLVEEEQ